MLRKHEAKPCFIFHAPQVRFISKNKKALLTKCFLFLERITGLAFLRKSHGRAKCPPDTLLGHAFRLNGRLPPPALARLGILPCGVTRCTKTPLPFLLAPLSSPDVLRSKKTDHRLVVCFFVWSGLRGSNPPPRPWQGRALPNELNPHIAAEILPLVPPVGIEPTTRGFSVLCSTN